MLLHFVRQRNQTVGFAAHGGYDDDDIVSFGAGFSDTFSTFLMRSGEPTDVPPYLCTINAMFHAFLCGIGRAAWFAGKAAIITIFT